MKMGKTDHKLLSHAVQNEGRVSIETHDRRQANSFQKLSKLGMIRILAVHPYTYQSRHFIGDASYYKTRHASLVRGEITTEGRAALAKLEA